MDDLDIFSAAMELGTPEEREKYLHEACGDNKALRERIEVLLRSSDKASRFMEAPAPGIEGVPTLDQPITERPGTVIGPYKLLQEIGHGGMGVVYMAEQTEPVERRVALKIIKPGMDTRQVIARFEAERQALAMMDHPNIARVLDAGTTDSGRPYFVMELVKGTPITEYCDEHHLSTRQRLELFVPVCQAVQHAHQKGIIHRDIKPTNVLIAEYDDRAVPKVIDFGIAKAVEHRLTEKTMFTELGQVVGTPEYMSPEQAKLNQLDIDTRSDIYTLGVLLYELLIGETPFDRQRLRSAAFDELLRIIREEEPPRPSIRLSTSETLPSIAANRQIEPKKLSTLVRGELDWIVMKAMEKDRTRRYETANGFAVDIQRYLDDEQVEACPPSVSYRLRKHIRRNKVLFATTAIVAMSLIVGSSVATWQAIRATRERNRAIVAEGDARRESERAKKAESKAQTEAVRADEEARIAVSAADSERSARHQAQQHLHDAKMQLIADAYDDANRPRVLQLLSESKPLHDPLPFEWRYWWRQCHRFVRQIDVDNSEIVVLSPDRRTVITCRKFLKDDGHGPQLWNVENGELLGELKFEPEPTSYGWHFKHVAFSSDSSSIAVLATPFSQGKKDEGGELVAAPYRVTIWNPVSLESHTLTRPTGGPFLNSIGPPYEPSLALSPDGEMLALLPRHASAADRRHEVFLVKVSNGKTIHVIRPQDDSNVSGEWDTAARCAEFSPDGSLLAIGGIDHHGKAFVQLWKTATGQLHKVFDPQLPSAIVDQRRMSWGPRLASGVYDIHFVRNGTQLLAEAKELITWDIESGRELFRVPEPPEHPRRVGQGLAVSNQFRYFTLTSLGNQETSPPILANFSSSRSSFTFSEDGTLLITGCDDRTASLQYWDVSNDRLASDAVVLQGPSWDGYNLFAFSPDGYTVASCTDRGTVEILETDSWRRLRTLDQDYLGAAYAVAFSPNGQHLATAGRDRETGEVRIDVRDLATNLVRQIGAHHNAVSSLEFSADGNQLASCDQVGAVRVWDCETARVLLAVLDDLPAEVERGRIGSWGGNPQRGDLCLDAGGRLFVSTHESLCRLFDIVSDDVQFRLPGADPQQAGSPGWLPAETAPLAPSPDGRLLAVPYAGEPPMSYGGGERRIPIRLINTSTWRVENELAGNGQFVRGLAFSPDGCRLVSTTQKSIIVWNLATGTPVLRLQSDSTDLRDRGYAYSTVAFSPAGDMLALAGNGELRIIRVATTAEIESGASSIEQVADQERAKTLETRAQWPEAIAGYTQAIEENPDDDRCWWGRARCYAALGKPDQALADYEQVVTLFKRFGGVADRDELTTDLRRLAQNYEKSGRPQQALSARKLVFEIYQGGSLDDERRFVLAPRRLALDPLSGVCMGRNMANYLFTVARNELAQAFVQAGQPLEAIDQWCHALVTLSNLKVNGFIGPSKDQLRGLRNWAKNGVNRLLSLEESGSVEEQQARFEALDKAIRDGCECPVLLSVRGDWHVRSGDIQAALADFTRAIELDPDDHALYASRAEIHRQLENYDQAIADYTEAIRLNPTDHVFYGHRADTYLAMACYDLALNDARELVRLKPLSPWGHRIQGQALVATENYDQAISELNEFIRLDSVNVSGRKLRAEAYSSLGRYEEALEDCDSVLSLRPEDPVPALIRAQILVMAGRTEEYRQACQTMLDRFGQSTEPNDFCHAARVCILAPDAVADPNVPVELARRAASENPPQWILYVLGMAYFRAGQLEDAARSFHDSLEKDPEWPGIALNWLGLAMVEQAHGKTGAARQWLAKATTAMEERSARVVQTRLESALLRREIERSLEASTGTNKEKTDTSE